MASMRSTMNKAASSVILLAKTTPRRNYFTTLNTSTNPFRQGVFRTIPTYHHHHLSTLANERSYSNNDLVRVIGNEIYRAEEEFHDLEVAEAPIEFPFKMEVENAKVTLTREYQGEEIIVTAQAPTVCHVHTNEEEKKSTKREPHVPMVARVAKKDRPTLEFRFGDGLRYIDLKNASLDGNLQEDLRAYLEVRGITPSLTKFLANHMVRKEHMKYIASLNSLKNFIAN